MKSILTSGNFLNIRFLLFSLIINSFCFGQNLTLKKEYYAIQYGGGIHYEYQTLPNGVYHGYFKEFRSNGSLSANITKRNGKSIKGIYYFEDGKTIEREFNQNEYETANGIQKFYEYDENNQYFLRHSSNWKDGSIISAKTMYDKSSVKLSIENNLVKRYSKIDGKHDLLDKFYVDPSSGYISGFIKENDIIFHFKNGLIERAYFEWDTTRILINRISSDSLERIYRIDLKDTTQQHNYFQDTNKYKITVYWSAAFGIEMKIKGIKNETSLVSEFNNKYSNIWDELEGKISKVPQYILCYKYLNYPNVNTKILCFESEYDGYLDLYKYKIWYDLNGKIKTKLVFTKINNSDVQIDTYNSENTIIKTEKVRH